MTGQWTQVSARGIQAIFFGRCVYNPADALQVTADTGMNVQVAPGACHIQGAMAVEDSPVCWRCRPAGSWTGLTRWWPGWTWHWGCAALTCMCSKGTPAEIPAAPALTRNNTVWELGLADLFVQKAQRRSPSSASPIQGWTRRAAMVITPQLRIWSRILHSCGFHRRARCGDGTDCRSLGG